MAAFLSLSPTIAVFPCPACGQTINNSVRQCPFCAATIDPAAAQRSAEATSRISQACSDASYLKIMAWMLLTFFGVAFLPFLGMIGAVGLWFLRFAIPVMVVRWWIRYRAIQTPDPDFARARKTAIAISVVALLAVISIAFQIR